MQVKSLALTLSMCLLGMFASGEAHPSDSPESLLWEVRQTHLGGDFESAWNAYMSFFRHPGRNQVDMMTFSYCFQQELCPDFARLGAHLGKTKSEFDSLGPFCPQWQDAWVADRERHLKPDATAETVEFFKTIPDRILRGGLGTDCAGWPEIMRQRLHDAPVNQSIAQPDVVPIRLTSDKWGFRPEVKLRIGSSNAWALVDTGATGLLFQGDESFRNSLSIDGLEVVGVQRIFDISTRAVRLPSLHLGHSHFRDVTVTLIEANPELRDVLLGMTVLLRYKSVCFAWKEKRLYLGDLGPCAHGIKPNHAIVSPWFLPFVEVRTQHQDLSKTSDLPYAHWKRATSQSWIVVDTGATRNYCSNAFASKTGGRFKFGDNDLTAACTNVGGTVFEDSTIVLAGVIGMETLLKFDAFGWELNPFRLYFVPKAGDF